MSFVVFSFPHCVWVRILDLIMPIPGFSILILCHVEHHWNLPSVCWCPGMKDACMTNGHVIKRKSLDVDLRFIAMDDSCCQRRNAGNKTNSNSFSQLNKLCRESFKELFKLI